MLVGWKDNVLAGFLSENVVNAVIIALVLEERYATNEKYKSFHICLNTYYRKIQK